MTLREKLEALKPNMTPIEIQGETFYVRSVSARGLCAIEQLITSGEQNIAVIRQKLLVVSLCDADGKLLYAEDEYDRLSDLPNDILTQLAEVAAPLNQIQIQIEAAVDLEKKDLETPQLP
jgi:hypothetical protein